MPEKTGGKNPSEAMEAEAEVVELECSGPNREFRIKGVTTANDAADVLRCKYRFGDPHLTLADLVVGGLTARGVEGASDSWLVQVRYVMPSKSVECGSEAMGVE